ncbi:nucleolar and coiled-body phosphoprotein 1-like [Penaeus vannamei]|uniref:nucleolar and coiled-body phosphoprotein 1-like n=1 Tax=Penaeus vannamei TaxID=6689 RepID=UPI00387F762B
MAGGAKTGLRRVKAAHVLRRCFTLEDPPTAAFPDDVGGRRVVRAASEEEAWASPLEADGEVDMTAAKKWRRPARHSAPPSRCASTPPSPGAPTAGRVRREAWAGPAGSQSKVENVETPTKPAKSKSHARPKSCVTPVSSHKAKAAEGDDEDGAKAPSISKAKRQSPKRPPEEPPPATPTPSIQIKISSAEETQAALPPPSVPDHPSAPPASDKVPKVPQQTRKSSPTEPGVRNKGDLEPYDGLSVQKAPILPQASKREGGGTPLSSLSDNQEDNDDALSTSSQKLKGYKPKNGFEFLPFSKLFTKPSSRYSSRSSSCDPDLGVENTYHQFNDCEKEIISKTRTALKQRITSANQRRISNTKNKKIHLNIVVNAQPDSDDSALFSDPEEAQAPRRPLSADSGTKRKNKTKNAKTKDRDLPPPPQTIRKPPKEPTLNKKQALKSDSNKPHDKKDETRPRDTAKRIRKREIPTIMSEISPVPSDIEQEIIVPPPRLSTSSASTSKKLLLTSCLST